MLDYFYGNETEQYLFYQVPVILIKEPKFKPLSGDAKLLYGLFLSRTSLSARNNWRDEQGRVYIIYTIEEIMDDMSCSEKKAIKLTKELKDVDLIETVRRGLNKPNLIYVKNFATVLKYQKQPLNPIDTRNCNFDSSGTIQNDSSRTYLNTVQEHTNLQANYNDFKKDLQISYIESKSKSTSDNIAELSTTATERTDRTKTIDSDTQQTKILEMKKGSSPIPNTYQSNGLNESPSKNTQSFVSDFSTIEKVIQENISYNYFLQDKRDVELVNNFVACMVDTMLTDDNVKITISNGKNKETKPIGVIKSVFMRINHEHIQHAIDQYKGQHHKITYKIPYMRNMLYNTYLEMDAHYTNQVRADGVVW